MLKRKVNTKQIILNNTVIPDGRKSSRQRDESNPRKKKEALNIDPDTNLALSLPYASKSCNCPRRNSTLLLSPWTFR
jgi:hypothetical protein